MILDPRYVQVLTAMLPPRTKKELQSFLSTIKYLIKFSPMTAEFCNPLQRLTSVKTDWTWNRMYQDLFNKAKRQSKKMHE